jgi:hypothetical protein
MPIPEELKGKSPEEIYDALANEHTKEVEEMRKDFLAKLPKVSPEEPKIEPKVYQQPIVSAPVIQDYYTNPEEYVKGITQQQINNVVGNYSANQRPINEQVFIQSLDTDDRELYVKYKDEINQNIDLLPPQGQANLSAFNLVYNVVLGKHRKEIEKERFEKNADDLVKTTLRDKIGLEDEAIERAFQKEPPQPQRSLFGSPIGATNIPQPRYSGQNTSQKRSPKLDSTMKSVAAAFGMSDDEYMKSLEDNISNTGRG